MATESMILFDLGQTYRDMQRLDQAVEVLQRALALADSINAKSESFNAHLLLAEIYGELDNPVQALDHYKQFHALKELVHGEKADERLKVLQVAHDTETARKEAEISLLRTVQLEQEIAERTIAERTMQEASARLEQQVDLRTAELRDTVVLLQREIEDRQRAEAEIQQLVATLEQRVAARTDELATFFDLTLLAGQADNPNEVFVQALPRITEVTQSRAICIHLFDADHRFLCLAGQMNLVDEPDMMLETVQPEADFQRWLLRPADPLMSINLAEMTILPAVLRPAAFHSYLGAQIKVGNRIEGVLSCYRHTARGFGVDEIALVTALAEQLGMTLETQRLRRQAEEMAVVEERQRLARDLHDSVTQTLYSLSLFSRAGRDAAEDGDIARMTRNLVELERNTLHALREMRLLLYELRPADLQQEGLVRALELRLNTVERRVGMRLDVHLEALPALPSTLEVELYHMTVEALNNVVKHAAASRLSLRLTAADGQLHLNIADDGQGFDPAQATGGLGLRNIRERVAHLHGQLSIESSPGRGVRLAAVIPYPTEKTP
jgi:signal transduction histidine kinase